MAHSFTGPEVLIACAAAPAPRLPQPISATLSVLFSAACAGAALAATSVVAAMLTRGRFIAAPPSERGDAEEHCVEPWLDIAAAHKVR